MNIIDVKLNLPTAAEIQRMFNYELKFDQYKVLDAATRAGAQPIVKRAQQLAPRGNQSNRDKRSRSQKSKANWDIRLWKTINHVVRKYPRSAVAVIGPEWPDGNKAYFDGSPKGRRVFYWKKDQNKVRLAVRNWIVQAQDETKQEQLGAMKGKLQELIPKVMHG